MITLSIAQCVSAFCTVASSLLVVTASAEAAELQFSSDFDSGNGTAFQLIGENHYQFEFEDDSNSTDRQWFYFEVKGANESTLTFDLIETEKTNVPGHWRSAVPVYSNDAGATWQRIATQPQMEGTTYRFTHEFTSDTVRLAFHDPYPLSRINSQIAQWQQSPWCTASERIGESTQGRPLTHLTITDTTVPAAEKVGVWVIARQHAAEVTGSFVLEGMMEFLLSNDSTAQLIRRNATINVIPVVNPDGVVMGNYRDNAQGVNLNRVWNGTASMIESPEVVWAKRAIKQWVDAGNNYTYFFDLHSTSGAQPHFAFHSTANQTSEEYYARLQAFLQLIESFAPAFDASIGRSSALTSQLAEDSNYIDYGVIAFTFEAGYNNQTHGPEADEYMTPAVHKSVGVGIAKAVAATEGWE
ncbi:MAG: M14-type cytosolic carboxypeptidase [Sumerlaeia bacterium]